MGEVLLERRGAIAIVTLSRPDKHNSMTAAMWDAVPKVFADIDRDDDVLVTVLRGAGDSFCAGSDISALEGNAHASQPIRAELAIAASPKPVVAAIEGHCHGGGCELALAADIRVAGEGATFSVPPARLGIVYPVSATQRMIDLMGPAITKELLFTARRIDAARAVTVGMVNEMVPSGTAFDAAIALAEQMTRLSQLTLRASKDIVDRLTARDLDAETAISWVQEAAEGPDLQEGIAAFAERRRPQFQWRSGAAR
ncbi:enoyl-CoA hydratase/isomerase family protein [Tessaracoccus caeni]|uniref:enoyl-CoA hydratase/isomerase family protein n=1 Tax=Tessaracoccus caeni TaxID=3031239 RepID=UPI0023DA4329|nr:enoyl-CoA hydratase/isomerase family protein [Tessaracoccus caeni]MDF1487014.1 enoyl-CoA hydratase/isomerase family protein [Tessaracoccus caeni]